MKPSTCSVLFSPHAFQFFSIICCARCSLSLLWCLLVGRWFVRGLHNLTFSFSLWFAGWMLSCCARLSWYLPILLWCSSSLCSFLTTPCFCLCFGHRFCFWCWGLIYLCWLCFCWLCFCWLRLWIWLLSPSSQCFLHLNEGVVDMFHKYVDVDTLTNKSVMPSLFLSIDNIRIRWVLSIDTIT